MVLWIQLLSLSLSLIQKIVDRDFTSYLIVIRTTSMALTLACHIASFRVLHIWYTRQHRAMHITFFLDVVTLHFFSARLLSEEIRTFDPSHAITASKHVLLNLHAKNRWSMDSLSSPHRGHASLGVTPSLNSRSLVLSLLRRASQRMNLVLGMICLAQTSLAQFTVPRGGCRLCIPY